MQVVTVIQGRIGYVSTERILAVRGSRIFESKNGGSSWKELAVLPASKRDKAIMSFSLLRRLLRKGVHHLGVGNTCVLIVANRDIYQMQDGLIRWLGLLNGSRPLALCAAKGTFYYGEYFSNPECSPVHIWKLREEENQWQVAWRFSGIRHVHGVFHDQYENALWVTTGDVDNEAGIWRTDNGFKTLQKVVGGSQQVRAIQLLFSQEHVYFGSDTPNEKNHIYRMDREGKRIEKLVSVSSSVFYGCKVKDCLFFSTAVEPSYVNTSRYAEIWGSADGVSWRLIRRFKKDFWPMKYFQYGQIFFPSGPGDDGNLWFAPMGVKFDPKALKIPLHECEFKAQFRF
jgi:hypothetical protein